MSRAVAIDMESIFGPQLRPSAPVVPRPEPEVLRRSRGWARIAAVGLLSVTAMTGVITGKSVTASPAARPVDPAPARIQPAPPASARAAPVFAGDAVAEVAAPAPAAAVRPPSATYAVAAPPAPARPDPRPRPVAPVQEAAAAPGPAPAPAAYRAPAAPTLAAAAAPTRMVLDCDRDPQACFAARVEWADRRTGEAFEDAAAAGVRPKTLREYESEWIRARGKAGERPAEALRIMAMITHDLKQLTRDPDLR